MEIRPTINELLVRRRETMAQVKEAVAQHALCREALTAAEHGASRAMKLDEEAAADIERCLLDQVAGKRSIDPPPTNSPTQGDRR
jgi:hypothetical protein